MQGGNLKGRCHRRWKETTRVGKEEVWVKSDDDVGGGGGDTEIGAAARAGSRATRVRGNADFSVGPTLNSLINTSRGDNFLLVASSSKIAHLFGSILDYLG
jgi:hypothetical protein